LASSSSSRAVVRIEILRVDVRGGAIGLSSGEGQAIPKAGSVRISVIGRGRIGVPDGEEMAWLRDTGDVIATDEFAAPPSAEAFLSARERSVESTSRRLGQRIVQRLLLLP
jgi:hypothetical protein